MVSSIAMYAVVIVPNLKLLADPTNVDLLNRSSIRTERDSENTARGIKPPDWYTDPLTKEERTSALKIIAATNTIILLLLTGIALLQIGEVWIDETDKRKRAAERERAGEELRQRLKGKGVAGTEPKKDR